jgi:hypothetical protein
MFEIEHHHEQHESSPVLRVHSVYFTSPLGISKPTWLSDLLVLAQYLCSNNLYFLNNGARAYEQ